MVDGKGSTNSVKCVILILAISNTTRSRPLTIFLRLFKIGPEEGPGDSLGVRRPTEELNVSEVDVTRPVNDA